MIGYTADLDDREVSAWLRALNRSHLPQATARGINTTTLRAQAAVRARMDREMELRRRDWAHRSIKVTHFANVRELWARLAVETPGNASRSDILTQHEEGGTKQPRGESLAIPDSFLTKDGKAVVPRSKRPKAFDFTAWGKSNVAEVFRGKSRTFLIKKPGGLGGIYQRTTSRSESGKRLKGAGRGTRRMVADIETRQVRDMNIRILFRFTPDAPLQQRLHFVDEGMGQVNAYLSRDMGEALELAIRAGKASGGKLTGNDRRIALADVHDVGRSRMR